MTDIEALQNQFHDELHTTNLKVIDVSTNLADLSDRVDAISDSNKEVNDNINSISVIVDELSSAVKDLRGNIAETNNEVRMVKAPRRSASVSNGEIDELHKEIHEVALAVDNLDSSISPIANEHSTYIDDLYDNVNRLYSQDASICQDMIDMDVEHHEELHRLAMAIDNLDSSVRLNTNRINFIINNYKPHVVLTETQYNNLESVERDTFYFTYEE